MPTRSIIRPVVRGVVRPVVRAESSGSDPAPPATTEAFTIVMRTTGASETVTLPLANVSGSVDVDWGDGSSVETVSSSNPAHVYATADDYTIAISGTGAGSFLFSNAGDKLKLREIVAWGTEFDVSSFSFWGCSNLATADATGDSGADLTSMSRMFENCSSLSALDVTGLDTSGVSNMLGAFRNTALTSDPGLVGFGITSLTDATNLCRDSNNMLSTAEYNAILVAWEAQAVNNSVAVHFGDATHSGAGSTARAALVADHSWTITDGGAA